MFRIEIEYLDNFQVKVVDEFEIRKILSYQLIFMLKKGSIIGVMLYRGNGLMNKITYQARS